ncbi:zinc finger CCCH domain-containing protein 55-like isoform X3 [Tripterygium wilfordii]|uniref:Zinc finger CCCH domain-containing protein 55-like isoform X3 n=1 Tax=Tripterygium wilfordii TaxID=458696 RepID=A0A7J7CKQ3_TRIWF|nr:zinc finger CCCH domain-containing protein 55-like isoform X3 [Tripterygium wilfordii]
MSLGEWSEKVLATVTLMILTIEGIAKEAEAVAGVDHLLVGGGSGDGEVQKGEGRGEADLAAGLPDIEEVGAGPPHNHAGEFMGDRVRRDKGQVPDCFDFLRGRCYRAAFCRYRHHDRDEGDGSRHYRRSKQQYLEMHPSSKKSSVVEEIKNIPLKASDAKLEEINMDMSCGSFGATESGNFESDTLQSFIPHTAGQLIDADVTKFDSSKEGAAKFPERQSILEEPKEVIVHSCNSFMKKTECHHPFVMIKFPLNLMAKLMPDFIW